MFYLNQPRPNTGRVPYKHFTLSFHSLSSFNVSRHHHSRSVFFPISVNPYLCGPELQISFSVNPNLCGPELHVTISVNPNISGPELYACMQEYAPFVEDDEPFERYISRQKKVSIAKEVFQMHQGLSPLCHLMEAS